jgi:hypothetical protein
VDVVFRFEASPTVTNIKIAEGTPSEISIPLINGFDLLWVAYEEVESATQLTVRPRQANIEVVCQYVSFKPLIDLGIL